jgi:DNA processing protein
MNTWLALSLWCGMTVSRLQKLKQRCGSLQQLFALNKPQWLQLGFAEELYATRISPTDSLVVETADWLIDEGVTLLGYEDTSYPANLREVASAPLALYARGEIELLAQRQLAIVGSRKATPKAMEVAFELAAELAANDVVVTSGLALGIDTAAHRGALEGGGKTIAVMANGLASVYPPSNWQLAEQIVESGVLLSEQPPRMEPKAKLFPQRNRIVSGLSQGVLVVQGNRKSGSMITARLALEQNREVMAVPGEVGSEQASGCHWLLKQGAALVENVEDIYAAMGWEKDNAPGSMNVGLANKIIKCLTPAEQALLVCIDNADTALEKIYERYNGDSSVVLSLLSQLELSGAIQRTLWGYCRC